MNKGASHKLFWKTQIWTAYTKELTTYNAYKCLSLMSYVMDIRKKLVKGIDSFFLLICFAWKLNVNVEDYFLGMKRFRTFCVVSIFCITHPWGGGVALRITSYLKLNFIIISHFFFSWMCLLSFCSKYKTNYKVSYYWHNILYFLNGFVKIPNLIHRNEIQHGKVIYNLFKISIRFNLYQ